MEKVLFKIGKDVCDECSMALRRFMGHVEGVESIDAENDSIAVYFNETKVTREKLHEIAKDSIEKLGYALIEQ